MAKPQPPRNPKRRSDDPARDVIEEIVETEKTKDGLIKRLLLFWSVSTAEAQVRGFEIAKKVKEDKS